MSLWKSDNRRCSPLLLGCLLLVLIAPSRGFALDPARSIYQYNCQTWRRQNGLTANAVNAITQTKDGYLWLGTSAGLVRFDGSEFKLFDLSHLPQAHSTIVSSLCASERGGFWFGVQSSAFGFCDGTEVTLLGKDAWGGMNLNVNSILETKEGDVWLATETLAARLTKDKVYEPVMVAERGTRRYHVASLCQDSRGRIFLGTSQQGLFYWQDGKITKFPDPVLDDLIISCITEDRQGQIWIGTQLGLRCYDANLKRNETFPYPWYATRALLVDRQGVLWAGTVGGGLVRILNGVLTELRKTDGLADDVVTALAEDREGSLWIGTRNGLSQLSDVKIPTIGKPEGLTAEVNIQVCASRKGGFWVANSDGFTYFDGYAHNYSTNVGLRVPYIKNVFEAKNGDLYLFNGVKDVEVFSGDKVVARYPNRDWPTAMVEDHKGVIVSARGGLFRAGTNYFEPYVYMNDNKPPLLWIFNMASGRDGSVWIASGEGICNVKDGEYTLWSTNQGLADTKVTWICEDDDGVVWAGQETGMVRIKDGKVRLINRDNGLFDNLLYAIVPDDHGNLWVDSSRGFFRVSRQSLNNFADGKTGRVQCEPFNGLDVVKSTEKYQQVNSGCKTLDGRIWFPTAQGVVMIDPTNLTSNPVPPPVHIDIVHANGLELSRTRKAVVRPGDGNLEFHYVGVCYIAPLKIQYRYRLVGFDKEWVEAGTRRAAFYTNLKPGKYQFEVQACNEDGVWNTTGDTFAVELLPRFYQTAWFMVLAGTSVVAGLLGIYVWRLRLLTRKEKHLKESRDLLEAKVLERTAELKGEIEERKRIQLEVEQVHLQLLDASRHAGQAEVASSVLHNVGNVLNSVNVSTSVIGNRIRGLRLGALSQAAQLMQEHADDFGRFVATDEKGRQLPQYLEKLSRHLGKEQEELMVEIKELAGNVEHIKEIVAMQQSYASLAGFLEKVDATQLVESALKMHSGAFARHSVKVLREYERTQPAIVDKHKLLQILVNVLHNAKYACDEGGPPEKTIIVRVKQSGADRLCIEIADNGIGIAPENLTRIFAHGFTTRKNGHGFGLHSAALGAQEMGGTLRAHSDGVRRGATFTLELPIEPPSKSSELPSQPPADSLRRA